jgi:putative DNA primase/helicase
VTDDRDDRDVDPEEFCKKYWKDPGAKQPGADSADPGAGKTNGAGAGHAGAGPRVPRPNGAATVTLVSGGKVKPVRYQWVWSYWLPKGKLVILAGAVSAGKTTIAISIAATITRGGVWPDGTPVGQGDAVVWSGEDSVADTLLPRFLAAGGDRNRIHFVSSVSVGDKKRSFNPSTDMPALLAATNDLPSVALIMVDSVVLMVAGDSHKNAEVRRGLQPLVDFAAERNAVALGFTHLTKNTAGKDPVERLTGSLAFGAGPRLVMMAAKSQELGQPRRLVRVKSNVGPDGDGFEYTLDQVLLPDTDGVYGQQIIWGNQLYGPAWELLNGIEELKPGRPPKERTAAMMFLLTALEKGPQPTRWVKHAAKEAGLAWRTVERACADLQIVVTPIGGGSEWQWALPADLKSGEETDL